jgi:hypothetical protein
VTTLNALATLAEYKAWIAVRGLDGVVNPDASDDLAMELILRGVSRYIENQSRRQFVPTFETRYYNISDDRVLWLDGDLLEVTSLVNGEGTAIASSEYYLESRNLSPKYSLTLKQTSTVRMLHDAAGNSERVISLTGVWGYHDKYPLAWLTGSTLAEALDISETGFDVASSDLFTIGQLVRIENELSYLSEINNNTLTGTRGENGSTPATHSTSTAVKIWQVQDDIKTACLQIAQSVYAARSGQSSSGKITITAAGVVIRPEEVPPMAKDIIESYVPRVW